MAAPGYGMKRLKRCLNKTTWTILVFVLAISPLGSKAEQLKACGHSAYAPWNWESNGKVVGVCAEVVETLFNRLGVDVDLTYIGPWKRCQRAVESGDVDVNICAFINEERKTYSRFTETPMGINENAVFVRRGYGFEFNHWDDLKGRVGGMVLGVSIGQHFDDFLAEHVNVVRVRNFETAFRMLAKGRIDFVPSGRYSGMAQLRAWEMSDFIDVLPHPILEGNLYISISNKSPWKSLLPEIDRMLQEPGYAAWVESLFEKYTQIFIQEEKKRSDGRMNDSLLR